MQQEGGKEGEKYLHDMFCGNPYALIRRGWGVN